MSKYELFDWNMQSIGTADELLAARGPDAVSMARRALPAATVIVLVDSHEPIMAFGRKPGMHLRIAREALMPGVERGDA